MSPIRCCYNCLDRSIGCHSKCERYLKEKEKMHKEYENRMREKEQREASFIIQRRNKR